MYPTNFLGYMKIELDQIREKDQASLLQKQQTPTPLEDNSSHHPCDDHNTASHQIKITALM